MPISGYFTFFRYIHQWTFWYLMEPANFKGLDFTAVHQFISGIPANKQILHKIVNREYIVILIDHL